jgi:DNA processing protein
MDYLPWIALKSAPGIGNLLFKRLMDRFGDPSRVLCADIGELTAVQGISKRLALEIKGRHAPKDLAGDLETALKNGCRVTVMTDGDYPPLLKEIPDPPPLLVIAGQLLPNSPSVAVVGSRSASRYGLSTAHRLSADLASSGITVVSGLARGIDTSAHEGALSRNGRTVAVLGSGLGRIYPPENTALARRISENGAVISEFTYHAGPEPHHFPMRNRIISGLCLGTVVVEAALKSGSLITARLAMEQNREVFAVPGSIQSHKSTGTHGLIRQGAKLVETVSDILEEIRLEGFTAPADGKGDVRSGEKSPENLKNKNDLDFDELSVLKVLDSYPVHIDDILQNVSMETGALSAVLLRLELKGMIVQAPGKMFFINEDLP